MALKGNLSSSGLAEVFQTLSQGHSTGLLRIQAPEGARFVEIQDGAISIVANASNRVLLGDLLVSRGLLQQAALQKALASQKESGKLLGQVLVDMGIMKINDLESALRFQVEEEICDLFLLKSGEFDFLANANLDAKMALGGGFVRLKIDANLLLQEAAKRMEEWRQIEPRIPDQALLFQLTAKGKDLLASGAGLSAEGLMLLKLAVEQRTVESMVQKGCLGRLNTNLLLTELWDAGLLVPAPAGAYLRAAGDHLANGRLEESERVAAYGLKIASEKENPEALKKILADVERKRKLAAGTDSATSGRARSEVIRRQNPAMILKQKRSPWPLIAAGVLVLGAAGAGVFFFFNRGKTAEGPIEAQKQYDAWISVINELVTQKKYKEAHQNFQIVFREPFLRAKAKEKLDSFTKEMEALVKAEIARTAEVLKGDQEEAYQRASEELELFNFNILSGSLKDEYQSACKKIRAWQEKKRGEAFEQRFKKVLEIEDGEPRAQAGEKLLAEPALPEEVAAKTRDLLARLAAGKRESEKFFALAKELEAAGSLKAAASEYEHASTAYLGTDLARKAAERFAAVKEKDKQLALQIRQLELRVSQAPEKAREELLRFLKENAEPAYAGLARSYLRGVATGNDETLAEEALREVETAERKNQHAEARLKRIEVLDKYPLTTAASRTTLRVKITSEPSGAKILINGKSQPGPTPLDAEVPGLGPVRISLQKKGFEFSDVVVSNCREPALQVTLKRAPGMAVRRMPWPASAGLAAKGDWAALLQGAEVALCNLAKPADTPLERRTAADSAQTPAGATLHHALFTTPPKGIEPDLLIGTQENRLWIVHPGTSRDHFQPLSSPPVSEALLLQDQGRLFAGVATVAGFECLELAAGTPRFAAKNLGAGTSRPGAALGEKRFLVAHADGKLYSLDSGTGESWSGALPDNPCGPPAWHSASKSVAVLGAAGKVMVYGAEGGAPRERELGAPCKFGPVACGKGFAVVREDGQVELLAAEDAKSLWTRAASKDATLPPVAVGENLLAVATPQDLFLLNAADGSIVWRAGLFSAPVALATDGERIVLSTQDASLLVFDAALPE